jgi:hypothetical protein
MNFIKYIKEVAENSEVGSGKGGAGDLKLLDQLQVRLKRK